MSAAASPKRIDLSVLDAIGSGPSLPDDRADILASTDLRQIFGALGMTEGRNRQWTCPSPTHAQTGATPPVKIGGQKGEHLWYCHGCGATGTAIDAIVMATGAGVGEVMASLRERTCSPTFVAPPRRTPPPPPPPLDPDDGRITDPARAEAVMDRYLTARQWRPDIADAFGLFAVLDHRGAERVRHPYRVGGEVKWWQDRAVDPGIEPKWRNPKGHPRVPYALDLRDVLAECGDGNPAPFVVEGPADVIALAHLDLNMTVIGIPGTSGAAKWAGMFADGDVFLMTDPDEAGDKAADELADAIQANGGRTARLRPPGVDVDDWRRRDGEDALTDTIIALAVDAGEWEVAS